MVRSFYEHATFALEYENKQRIKKQQEMYGKKMKNKLNYSYPIYITYSFALGWTVSGECEAFDRLDRKLKHKIQIDFIEDWILEYEKMGGTSSSSAG